MIKRLVELGIHLGHTKDALTNSSAVYVLGLRKNYAIIDLNITLNYLQHALWFLKKLGEHDGHLLFFNSNLSTAPLLIKMSIVNLLSIDNKHSTLVTKWKHGQLSNFYGQAMTLVSELHFNVNYKSKYNFKFNYSLVNLLYKVVLFFLVNKLESVTWAEHQQKYMKFWRFLHQFKYYNNFNHYPDSLIFICPNNKGTPAREAASRYLPLVTLIDTNSKHSEYASYLIPSNDDGYIITLFYYHIFLNAYLSGRDRLHNSI